MGITSWTRCETAAHQRSGERLKDTYAPERIHFSDAMCGLLRNVANAVMEDGSTWEAATKEPVTRGLARTRREEGCAKTIKPGGN